MPKAVPRGIRREALHAIEALAIVGKELERRELWVVRYGVVAHRDYGLRARFRRARGLGNWVLGRQVVRADAQATSLRPWVPDTAVC